MSDIEKIWKSRKILFVHQLLAMGDSLFLSPVYKTIKDNIEGVNISVLTNEYSIPFVKANPYVDDIYSFESVFKKNTSRLNRFLRLILFFKKNRIDTIVVRGDKRIPQRMFHLTSKICLLKEISLEKYLEEEVVDTRHIVDTYFKILERAGLEIKDRRRLYMELPEAAASNAKSLLNSRHGRWAGVAPVSNMKIKNWTPEKTAELIKKLDGMSYDVIFFCGNKEFAEKVQNLVGNECVTAVEHVSFSLLTGIISVCDIFIGVDTGLSHAAAALGVPTVGLYGPTSGIVTGLYSSAGVSVQSKIDCQYYKPTAPFSPKETLQECYRKDKCLLPMINCVAKIETEDVINAVHRLKKSKTGRALN